jgi:ATP-dependent Clp protease ATP-binding subunit ClpC
LGVTDAWHHGPTASWPLVVVVIDKAQPQGSLMLDQFGRNLTQLAREGKLDPVIGREREIERVMQVLSRRTKNNPLLIGEPGVGKTSIVEGLSQAIVKGQVPRTLMDKQIYMLDFALRADAPRDPGYRDSRQAEQVMELTETRLKKVVEEIRTRVDIILFLQDIRSLAGASAVEGGMNMSSLLRRALARQELQIICEATLAEYDDVVRFDSALAMLFQRIPVRALSLEYAIEFLKGLRERYEAHHRVTITDDALVAAVMLADRYIRDRVLPGKAIDLIDEAGSRMRIRRIPAPPDLREFDRRIGETRRDKESAIDAQDFEKASSLRDREKQLLADKARRERELKSGDMDMVAEVDEEQIAEVVAELLGDQEVVTLTGEKSNMTPGRRLLVNLDLFQESGDMWTIS